MVRSNRVFPSFLATSLKNSDFAPAPATIQCLFYNTISPLHQPPFNAFLQYDFAPAPAIIQCFFTIPHRECKTSVCYNLELVLSKDLIIWLFVSHQQHKHGTGHQCQGTDRGLISCHDYGLHSQLPNEKTWNEQFGRQRRNFDSQQID